MAPVTTRSKNLVRASRYSRIRFAAGFSPAATSAARASSAAASPYGAGILVKPRRYAATRWAVIDGPPLTRSDASVTRPILARGTDKMAVGVWQGGAYDH